MSKRLSAGLLSLSLIFVLLAGCSDQTVPFFQPSPVAQTPSSQNTVKPSPAVQTPSNQNTVTKYNRWLKGIPCQLPCWENITVGSTTITQAISILTNTNFLSLEFHDENNLSWEWIEDGSRGVVKFTDKIVSYIGIGFRNPPVKLQEIITLIGEPSHIRAYYTKYYNKELNNWDTTYYIKLLYKDQNIILETFPNRFKPELNKDIMIYSISLAKLDDDLNNPEKPFDSRYVALPWQGFNSFDFYCRTSEATLC
jgi:hypothetical protein